MRSEGGHIGRREFLRMGSGIALAPAILSACSRDELHELTILHTNDMHSHIEPFPEDHSDHPNEGGMARRASLVQQIREEGRANLLLDAGDIFQGTPYFNRYKGELEFRLMSMMDYDAATMGNHDFDNGTEGFDRMLPHAEFPFITTNYDLSDTPLAGKTLKSKVFERDGARIGVLGAGIQLEGLVSPKRIEGVRYKDPIDELEKEARKLRKERGCSLIIALSHLGHKYEKEKVCDVGLAERTRNIDVILGGHTHSFFDAPALYRNLEKRPVIVNQVGWGGLRLGRLELSFRKKGSIEGLKARNLAVKGKDGFRSRI